MLSYAVFFVTVAAILSIATLGLNLQWGISGQFNAGVVGFIAIGGYTLAILTMPVTQRLLVQWNLPFAVGLLAASLIAEGIAFGELRTGDAAGIFYLIEIAIGLLIPALLLRNRERLIGYVATVSLAIAIGIAIEPVTALVRAAADRF